MKSKFLIVFFVLEVLAFFVLICININDFYLKNIWFSISLFLIGAYAILYSAVYKLDSELYFGSLTMSFSVVLTLKKIYEIPFFKFYPIYILCFCLASLSVFVAFRQNIHLKMFAILFFEVIILTSYKLNYITSDLIIALNILFLLIVAIFALCRVGKNLRRVK